MQRQPHEASIKEAIVSRVLEGEEVKDLSAELAVPSRTIYDWRKEYDAPSVSKRRQAQRDAFLGVMDTYEKLRSQMGTSGAMDYSKVTGGQGAQSCPTHVGHQFIDYVVDVDKAAKDACTSAEYQYYDTSLKVGDYDLTNQSSTFLALQEKLGRLFIARGLYPTSLYFKPGKGK